VRRLELANIEDGRVLYFSNVPGDGGVAGLDVVEVGQTTANSDYHVGPWARNVHVIWVITGGKISVKSGDEVKTATTGDVVVIKADTLSEWWSKPPDLVAKWWLAVYGSEAYSLIRRLGVGIGPGAGVGILRRQSVPAVELELFAKLYRLGNTDSSKRGSLFAHSIAIFYQIYASILDSAPSAQPRYAEANAPRIVKNYIDMHYSRPLDREELAEIVGLTPQYLSTIFKAEYGISVHAYLTSVRIKRAKELLEAGFSVKETALSLGYPDPNYFSRMFRAQVGCPPTAYQGSARQSPKTTS